MSQDGDQRYNYMNIKYLTSGIIFLFIVYFVIGQENYFETNSPGESGKPNIIMLMADDLGYGDVGFNGNEKIITPYLDAISREGITFDHFYAAAPLCSPTRASCLTGRRLQNYYAGKVIIPVFSGNGTWAGLNRISWKTGDFIHLPGTMDSMKYLPQKARFPHGIQPGPRRAGQDLDQEKTAHGEVQFIFKTVSR